MSRTVFIYDKQVVRSSELCGYCSCYSNYSIGKTDNYASRLSLEA